LDPYLFASVSLITNRIFGFFNIIEFEKKSTEKGVTIDIKTYQMKTLWLIGIPLFAITAFLFWKITSGYYKKHYGEKRWKQRGARLFYWQAVLYLSFGITFLIMFVLKQTDVLDF